MKTLLAFLILGCFAYADQVNCVKWQDVNGNTVGTFCNSFKVKAGANVTFTEGDDYRTLTIAATGISAAAGSTSQIQFNTAGGMNASSGLTWDNATSTLTATHITGLDRKPFIDMVRDCGLVGDGVTNDSAAANACFALYPGYEFFFPKTQANGSCSYLFNSTLNPTGMGTIIRGGGGGSYSITFGTQFGGTELCFAPGVSAFKLDNVGTYTLENLSVNGQSGTQQMGTPTLLNLPAGSSLSHYTRNISAIQRATQVLTVTVTASNSEGLTVAVGSQVLISGVVGDATMNGRCIVASISNSATNPLTFTCSQQGSDSGPFGAVGTVMLPTSGTNVADGIWVCGNFITLRHVTIANFGRYGIYARSDDAGCTAPFADDLVVRDSIIFNNQGGGIFLKGADSNAGNFTANAIYYNGFWGVQDQSFLGNTWVGNQASYNGLGGASGTVPTTKTISTISRSLSSGVSTVSVVLSQADANIKVGSCVVLAGVTDSSFNTTAGQCFFVLSSADSTHYTYEQPGAPANASSSGGTSRMSTFAEAYLAAGLDNGSYKVGTQSATQGSAFFAGNYTEGGQNCKFGGSMQMRIGGAIDPSCVPNSGQDWNGNFISQVAGLTNITATNLGAIANNKDAAQNLILRAGVSGGTTRNFGFNFYDNNTNTASWSQLVNPTGTTGGSWEISRGSAGGGGVRRLGFFGATNGAITRINSESTAAVEINKDANSGTGGLVVASGSASPSIVATVDATGLGTFNGGVKAGSSGSTIADSRELVQSVHLCGTTTTCANTANGSYRMIFGNVTLSTGTALVGSITAFTSTSSFVCTGTDKTAVAAVQIVNTSTSSITINGTGSDSIDYQCVGK
jgi:hypothetical protein